MTRILIVDDKPENLYLLRALLTGHGCEVDEARHGAEALIKARQSPPRLIISDLLMPVMDGYTLLRHWKTDARLKEIPFIVHTATYTEPQDEKLALDLGADAFILKPAEPEEFMARVRAVLAQSCAGRLTLTHQPVGEEKALLKEYSETLVRKLEEKAQQLEQTNREQATREAHLRAILDTEPECVKLLGPDGALLEMNPAGLRMIEADSFQQVFNHGVFPLVVEEHRAAFCELTAKVFQGESGVLEFQIIGLKGTRRWLETHASPLRDAAGQVTALLGITRDITASRQMEESLRRQQEQLMAIMNSVDGIVWEADAQTFCFTFVSPRAERLLGYPLRRWTEEPTFWADHLHPDDREQAVRYCMQCTREKRDHSFEYRMLAADGRAVWLRDLVTVVVEGDQPVKLRGLMVDITERKRAEAALKESREILEKAQAFGHIGSWVAETAADGAISWSAETCRIFGFAPGEFDGRAQSFFDLIHPEDRERVRQAGREALRGDRSFELEYRIRRRDGQTRWLQQQAGVERDAAGRPWRTVGVVQDITARKRAEEQLRENEQRLSSIYDTVGDVLFHLAVEPGDCYRFLSVNRAFCRVTGLSPDKVVGRTANEVIPGPSLTMVLGQYRQAIERRSPVRWEETSDYPAGRLTGEVSVAPVFDEGGRCTALVGSVHDITERKRAEAVQEAMLSLAARLGAATTASDAARIIFDTADALWQWDAGTLDVYSAADDRLWAVLYFDVVEGTRRQVPPVQDADMPTPRMRRVMRDGAELILRAPPFARSDDGVSFGDTARPSASIMSVPIRAEGRAVGVLSLQSYTPNAYTEADLKLLQGLADHCGATLERLRAGEALRASEANHRTLVESASDAIFIVDGQGRLLEVNVAACRMFGYRREELLAMSYADLAVAEELPRLGPEMGRMKVGEVLRSEWQGRRKDGSVIPVEVSATLLPDGRLLGILRDVTERRQAEERTRVFGRLGQDLSAARTPLEAGKVIMAAADEIFGWDACSVEMVAGTEGSQRTILAMDIMDGRRTELPTTPGERPITPLRREIMTRGARLIQNDSPNHTPGTSPFGDVTRPSASMMFAPIHRGASVVGILSIHSYTQRAYAEPDLEVFQSLADYCGAALERITAEEALRESEERYHAIFKQAAVGVAQVAPDGRWLDVNQRLCEIVGYTREELLAGTFQDITHPDDLEADLEYVRRMLADEITTYAMEKRYRRKDGSLVWIQLTVSLVRGRSGEPQYFISVVQDVTRRKRAEEKLLTLSRRLLEVQEEERRHLARELHDQIGQALTAVQLNLQAGRKLAAKSAAGQRLADSLEILEQVQAQVQFLSLELRPALLDDLGLVSALRGYLQQQAQRVGLRAHFHSTLSPARLDPAVETACFRVAQEAVTNVLRHARARTLTVSLGEDGGTLHLTVTDDGAGFDPANVRRSGAPGADFGLSGMEERVALAGGGIQIDSTPGAGTTVRVRFPLANRDDVVQPRMDTNER